MCPCLTRTRGRCSRCSLLKVSHHGKMGGLFGVSCRQSHPQRRRYLRSLDAHTWKGRSTCKSSDLAILVTVGWVASLVRVTDDHRPVDGGRGDLLPGSTMTNSCCMIVIIRVCHTLWISALNFKYDVMRLLQCT